GDGVARRHGVRPGRRRRASRGRARDREERNHHAHRLPLPPLAQRRGMSMGRASSSWQPQRGFTLLEAVLVIAMTGIVAAMVAVFIRAPVNAYVDQARRAELSDAADTALRRMAREVQRALPNSVRVD